MPTLKTDSSRTDPRRSLIQPTTLAPAQDFHHHCPKEMHHHGNLWIKMPENSDLMIGCSLANLLQ